MGCVACAGGYRGRRGTVAALATRYGIDVTN
jgi:hypothetical protein